MEMTLLCAPVFVFQLINQKTTMCTQLNNCRSFVSVLEYLLAIGNYLNINARKEKAKGFRLSSLAKVRLHAAAAAAAAWPLIESQRPTN